MKIVCDSCGAKYSIADEKVRGKVFKIRCKKCSEVIVVRGDASAEDAVVQSGGGGGPTPAPAAPDHADAIWHLVVNGEQQGPFSPDQISQMLSSGQVDWEAYAWRDGLEGWLHMREIEELVTAITGQPAAPVAAAPAEPAPKGGMFGTATPRPAGGEIFGGSSPEPSAAPEAGTPARSGGAASSRARGGAGADLFAAASAERSAFSPSGGSDEEDIVASKHDAGGGAGALTGARNENSVLFSLSNLQALATKGQAPAATSGFSGAVASGSSAAAPRGGFASGSGSGLIDIRALADGISPSSGGGGPSGGIDELLSIGGPSAFAPTLGAPVLMPASRGEGGKLLYVLLGVAALLVLGIIGLVVVILTREPPPPTAALNPPPVVQPTTGTPTATPAAQPAVPGTNEQPAPGEASGEQPAPTGSDGSRHGGHGTGPTKVASAATTAPTKNQGTAAPEPAPTKRPDSRTADLDELIGGALGEHHATKAPAGGADTAPAAPHASNLPAQPSRGDVASAMAAVNGAVRGCAGGQTGTASIRIVFASSGRVTTSGVTSPPFAGTPAGSCMARAVKAARVPPFANPSLTVTFPFVVR
jgi:predicted Zn finger-like uncharacterized protein